MALLSALPWRRILLVSALGLASPAMAQTGSMVPNVVTGTDSNGGQALKPVGNGSAGSVAMPVAVYGEGKSKTILTSSSTTACTTLGATSGFLAEIVNTGPATSVFLTLYDEGSSPTCAAADIIYGDGTSITIGAGQVIRVPIPLTNGLAYKLSGSLTSNLVIVRD